MHEYDWWSWFNPRRLSVTVCLPPRPEQYASRLDHYAFGILICEAGGNPMQIRCAMSLTVEVG